MTELSGRALKMLYSPSRTVNITKKLLILNIVTEQLNGNKEMEKGKKTLYH